MRAKCSLLMATLLAFFCYACNKNEDAVSKDPFSYTGNNNLIATIISQLKSTDFASTLQTQFPDTKADWEKNASYQIMSDSTSAVLVPLVNGSDTARNYVKINFDGKLQRIVKLSYYNYERDYLNNRSKYKQSLIGLDLKYLSEKRTLFPATFSADSASAFYVRQATKRFRKAAENTRRSNELTRKANANTTANANVDGNCDAEVHFDFYMSTSCDPYALRDLFYTYLDISLNTKATELGATYSISKNFPSFYITCSPSMTAFLEAIFTDALNLLRQQASSCNLHDQIFYMNGSCENGGPGDGGGGDDGDDEEVLCEDFEGNMSSGVDETFQQSEVEDDNGVSRTKIYEWVFYKQNFGLWSYVSRERGMQFNDNGVWKWGGMEHVSEALKGLVIGGTVTCEGMAFNTVPGIYFYGVELAYTMKFTPVAEACPFSQSLNFTSAKIFSIND